MNRWSNEARRNGGNVSPNGCDPDSLLVDSLSSEAFCDAKRKDISQGYGCQKHAACKTEAETTEADYHFLAYPKAMSCLHLNCCVTTKNQREVTSLAEWSN